MTIRGGGPRRLQYELGKAGAAPVPSRSTIYRVLVRRGLVPARKRKRRRQDYKRCSAKSRCSSGGTTTSRARARCAGCDQLRGRSALVNSAGIITLGGQVIQVGSPLAGQRARIRLDGQIMHVITQDGILWRILACPIPADQPHRIQGVRLAGPDPLPAARLTVQRKVSSRGGIQVARQRIQVGISHAGQTVTVELGDTAVQVIDQHGELIKIVPATPRAKSAGSRLTAADAGPRQCSTRQRSASCMRPPGSGTRSAAQSQAINPATSGGHSRDNGRRGGGRGRRRA
jgi:hypothetical protein